MRLWDKYRDTINKNCLIVDNNFNTLKYWRNRIFCNMMLYFAPLSIFSAVPGIIMSLKQNLPLLALVDLAALLLVFFISFNTQLSIFVRKTLFIVVLYIVAIALIYYLGSFGPGLLYLLVITIFCILIFSNGVAFISIAINAIICVAIGFAISLKIVDQLVFAHYTVGAWLAVSVNLIIVSVMMVLLLPIIFNGMQQSNNRYEMVARATSDTICDWNLETDIKLYNTGIYQMFGYAYDEVVNNGKWWLDRIHPDDFEKVNDTIQEKLTHGGLNFKAEFRFRCADGSYKYILYRSYILRNESHKAVRVISAMQDINVQKERENWLKLMESVITNANDAVVITNPISDDILIPKIIYANEAFARMTGYDLEEIQNVDISVLYGPLSDDDELHKLRIALATGQVYKGEIINYKRDRTVFWVNKTISPVKDENGNITHTISIERDVTERRNYIKAIEEQNRMLKEISWMQSHIVRAPLTRLMGLIDLLMNTPQKDIDQSEVLNYIDISAKELDVVIKEIVSHANGGL